MMYRLPICEIQHQTAASLPRLAMFFLLGFTRAAPRQVDKGRERERAAAQQPSPCHNGKSGYNREAKKINCPVCCGQPTAGLSLGISSTVLPDHNLGRSY